MDPSPSATWSEAELLRHAYAANLSILRPLLPWHRGKIQTLYGNDGIFSLPPEALGARFSR